MHHITEGLYTYSIPTFATLNQENIFTEDYAKASTDFIRLVQRYLAKAFVDETALNLQELIPQFAPLAGYPDNFFNIIRRVYPYCKNKIQPLPLDVRYAVIKLTTANSARFNNGSDGGLDDQFD